MCAMQSPYFEVARQCRSRRWTIEKQEGGAARTSGVHGVSPDSVAS